jgi:copper(I)-binding protein
MRRPSFRWILVLVGPLAGKGKAIQLESAWARRAPALLGEGHGGHAGTTPKGNGAVYVTIRNRGNASDVLLSVTSEAADIAELHQSIQRESMMMMQPVPTMEIPAGAMLAMQPGGYHILLASSATSTQVTP